MKSNSKTIIRKLARKDLASNPGRNVSLVLAIFMTTFMVATVISLCVNQIETQRIYTALYQGEADNEIEPIIYALEMMVVLLIIAGFLLVYNVMYVSISREIRFYGQLNTIGMSRKQIKRMIFQQVLLLCAIGIPLGLICSALVSLVAVPMFLSMYTQVASAGYSISFHPLIFIGAALLALIAVITGALKPTWKATQVSPIEAVRFSEYGFARKKIRTSAFSPIKMAWRNVFRMPKRAILVFCSLFLGMTVFLAVSVIFGSTSVDMFVDTAATNMKGDIYLRNGITEQYGFVTGSDMHVFTPEFMDSLDGLPGLNAKEVTYVHEIQMDIADTKGETTSLPGCVYGVNAKRIAELNKELANPIDEAAFLRGEFVIIRGILNFSPMAADSVVFSLKNMETPVSFELNAVLPSEFLDYYGIGYNRLPSIYMSSDLLKKLVAELEIYDIELDIERSEQKQALRMVEELSASHGNIILRSRISTRQEAQNIISTLSVMGNGISAILWLIGILNFINAITASILSRRHELALLESVGQSASQSKKTLVYEGLIYASVTLLLVGIFGNAITYGFFTIISRQFEYMVFTFPVASFFVMIFLVFAICLSTPRFLYHFVSRATIIDRLKEVE
ncbi:FtsX-like permease family protein [Lachnospiraceae bacterium ZAX-1]